MPHKQSPKAIETERIPRENVVLKKAGVILVVEHLPSTFKALSLISSNKRWVVGREDAKDCQQTSKLWGTTRKAFLCSCQDVH